MTLKDKVRITRGKFKNQVGHIYRRSWDGNEVNVRTSDGTIVTLYNYEYQIM